MTHELAHQWNAVDVSADYDNVPSWVWEGGAELLTHVTLKNIGVISEEDYRAMFMNKRNQCFEQLQGKSLSE